MKNILILLVIVLCICGVPFAETIVPETERDEPTAYGVPKELYEVYGDSIVNPEQDDYGYIRINFDESKAIDGYMQIKDTDTYIDSNGKLYEHDEVPKEATTELYPNITYSSGEDIFIFPLTDVGESDPIFRFQNMLDDTYGYMNTSGEIVIPAQFYIARDFSDGLAAVCRESGGPLEYINKNGETVITVEDADGYDNIYRMFPSEPSCDFSDGLAMINLGEFYIDKEGNRMVIENACGMYKQGLVAVRDPETELMGYADINGETVIPCQYKWARDFLPCGVALVFSKEEHPWVLGAYDGSDARYCRGYINTKGEVVIPIEYYDAFYAGARALYPIPEESNGIIHLFKDGYSYFYRYDGILLGKKPHMDSVEYNGEYYNINLAEYWEQPNEDGMVG